MIPMRTQAGKAAARRKSQPKSVNLAALRDLQAQQHHLLCAAALQPPYPIYLRKLKAAAQRLQDNRRVNRVRPNKVKVNPLKGRLKRRGRLKTKVKVKVRHKTRLKMQLKGNPNSPVTHNQMLMLRPNLRLMVRLKPQLMVKLNLRLMLRLKPQQMQRRLARPKLLALSLIHI